MGIIYRNILPSEGTEAAAVESICFPPNEAEAPEYITARAAAVPELFLAAYDEQAGRLAGFINCISTDEESFRDGFFTDLSLHDKDGANVMILGLEVLPEYRGHGIARALMDFLKTEAAGLGKKRLVLTCLDDKVDMYRAMGFEDLGAAQSSWGGESWHEMACVI